MEKDPKTQQQQALTLELLEMGFSSELIPEALAVSKTKQQAVNYLLGNKGESLPVKKEENIKPEEQQFQDQQQEDYKMIFVVRMDLKLALHKIAELTATSALKAYKQIQALVETDQLKEMAFYQWNEGGQKKIVVKSPNEKELLDLVEKAKKANINFVLVEEIETNLKFQKQQLPISKKQAKTQAKNQILEKKEAIQQNKPQEKKQETQIGKEQEKIAIDIKKPMEDQIIQGIELKPQKKIIVMGAFGPAAEREIDPLTKHFKLL